MNYLITQTQSKIWTFKAKQNTIDEQIKSINVNIQKVKLYSDTDYSYGTWYKTLWKTRLTKLKKELAVLRKIKRIRQ